MPIMAVHEQNDARGSARVLANTAKRCINREIQPEEHRVVLNSLYRLLKAYRTHRFTAYEYEPRSQRGSEALTLMPPMDRHVLDLRAALSRAFSEAYNGETEENAFDLIESVIKSIASRDLDRPSQDSERQRASAFLDAFINNLYARR
jgi:hypothetical protein